MLTQYKNIDQIKAASGSISAERFSRSTTNFLSFDAEESVYFNTDITKQNELQRIELHIYADATWITGNHKVSIQSKIPTYTDIVTKKTIKFPAQPIGIDLYKQLEDLKLTSGQFRIVVNFFRNLIGSYEKQHLRIDEISPDRREIRLRAIDADDIEFLKQITTFSKTVRQTTDQFFKTYLLNFSRNNCVSFINSVVIGEYLYVKLESELPTDIDVDFKCWIVEEQKDPYIDLISIIAEQVRKTFKTLANPNWEARTDVSLSSETDFKTWSELLGSSTQTSQQIIDSYFSGSLQGVDLNLDYSDFNNFIFYSSATERLKNFKFKLSLLEYYTSQSLVISQISGSTAQSNQQEYETYKTNLVSGFDGFEKYLYYQSASYIETSNPIASEKFVVADLTGSYITPAPKSGSAYPYILYPVSSSQFSSWYDNLFESASLYDSFNLNSLEYAIPEYIRFDSSNTSMMTFVKMLAQHYDILYTYIRGMLTIQKRDENPKLGMPNELLYSVAKQFGWNLVDGNKQQELWSYVLGVNADGTPQTGSNSINGTSMPAKDRTYAIWRRIVNNLPYLLKSKGTKRSIQALLACYGIPQSMISINEYGGPRIERPPVYEKLNFDYALDLIGNASGSVTVNYSASISAVELRFRTDNVQDNPYIPNTLNLITVGGNTVTIEFESGDKGRFAINGNNATEPIDIFDGEWASLLLQNSSNGNDLDLFVKKSKYGKIITTVSASEPGSAFAPNVPDSAILGSNTGGSRLVGQLQELRLWTGSISDSEFSNHTKAPSAYNSADPYNDLLFRLPLTERIDHAATSSLYGVQPISSSVSASFMNWTNNIPYDSIEETYYYDAISLGAGTFDDNKIRIEQNELVGALDVKTRAERSQFDKAPLDSKKLGVYFSPQTMIDEDIIAQLGFTNLDEYIGDPGEKAESEYPELIQVAQGYWKKYETRNDINAYMRMFTLFDLSFFKQLEQVLPARVNKMTGVLIQPNILERNKQTILPVITREDASYYTIIDQTAIAAAGDYLQYTGSIDGKILEIVAEDDDQWQMYLTASTADKYDSVIYSHEYLLRSGSEYITGSTPYWLAEGLCPAITSSALSEIKQIDSNTLVQEANLATTTFVAGTYNLSNTITYTSLTVPTIDGVTLSLNTKILVKNGNRIGSAITGSSNGLYVVTNITDGVSTSTILTRTGSYELDPEYNQLIRITSGSSNKGEYYIQVTDNPVTNQPLLLSNPLVPIYQQTNNALLYAFAEIQDYLPTGIDNQRYSGAKMSSPAFNVNSSQTIDGGPVAEWRTANPNQLIYQTVGDQGSFRLA
jgi:hypothetical protein